MPDLATVIFNCQGRQVASVVDRNRLAIDATLHVEFKNGEPVAVLLEATSSSIEYWVGWIATGLDRWTVTLVGRVVWPTHVEAVASAVKGRVSQQTIRSALERAMLHIRPADVGTAPHKFAGPLGQMLAVAERLRLCDTLQTDQTFVWTHYCMPLVSYLSLTCFDVLGQRREWVPFGDWLRSKKSHHKKERSAVPIRQATARELDAIDLYEEHARLYGVKQSFVGFIVEVLKEESRRRLLGSINAAALAFAPPPPGESQPRDDKWKTDYLYAKRNNYTHRAHGIDAAHPSLFPKHVFGERGWVMHDAVRSTKDVTIVMVAGWPDVLTDVVRDGLAAFVEDLANGHRAETR